MKRHQVFRCFRELIAPGILGNYSGCEVYHFFFQRKFDPKKTTYNLYTLVRLGVFPRPDFTKPQRCLNPTRIRISHNGEEYTVGIEYYRRSLAQLTSFYIQFLRRGVWNLSSGVLTHDADHILARQYVPADGTFPPALNGVLKNNFAGSYLIEHFDLRKSLTSVWRENPQLLLEVSDKISRYVPMRIASVSDRLGNIVFQFPNILVRSDFRQMWDGRRVAVDVRTGRGFSARLPLSAIATNEGENGRYLHGFGANFVVPPTALVRIDQDTGISKHLLYDVDRDLIYGSFYGTYTEGFGIQMAVQQPEARIIRTRSGEETVGLTSTSVTGVVAVLASDPSSWERERIFTEERNKLEAQRAFVQYGVGVRHTHDDAIRDIVQLIAQHGHRGAWLWDPYLETEDLIETFFRCPHFGTELRALGSYRLADKWSSANRVKGWRKCIAAGVERFRLWRMTDQGRTVYRLAGWQEDERRQLDAQPTQARLGLRAEFRVQQPARGWQFHDRFLLFPRTGMTGVRPRVWSLGTSVNGVGRRHHILHEVSHPAHIVRSFEELWAAVADPSCLVWRV
ncbi:MAG TPA: VPA1262 family N-terminal domain-containing protein [Elusimicrobiota bacterium]|nr:VPA1262 family N-terminal domain-containing protein [Elusimicrobiota bacterium]